MTPRLICRCVLLFVWMFAALLGGVAAFGFIGLIFGPVVIAVAMALFDAYLSTSASSATD